MLSMLPVLSMKQLTVLEDVYVAFTRDFIASKRFQCTVLTSQTR